MNPTGFKLTHYRDLGHLGPSDAIREPPACQRAGGF